MKYPHIENAKNDSCDIQVEGGFVLTVNLLVTYDGGSQSFFGGYELGGMTNTKCACNNHGEQKNLLAEWVGGVLSVAEAESLSDCKGKIIRVGKDRSHGKIISIGHALKDFWFDPSENDLFAESD